MRKLYTKYVDEKTGIMAKVSQRLTIKNSSGKKEFVFINSNQETMKKVIAAFQGFMKLADKPTPKPQLGIKPRVVKITHN